MSETARETPVSEFLFGMSLIVRVRVETHRSSRELRHSLAQRYTVKFARQLRTYTDDQRRAAVQCCRPRPESNTHTSGERLTYMGRLMSDKLRFRISYLSVP